MAAGWRYGAERRHFTPKLPKGVPFVESLLDTLNRFSAPLLPNTQVTPHMHKSEKSAIRKFADRVLKSVQEVLKQPTKRISFWTNQKTSPNCIYNDLHPARLEPATLGSEDT